VATGRHILVGMRIDPALDGNVARALNPQPAFGFTSITHAIALPKPKPWAISNRIVVPSISSRDVACPEWPNIWRFEHFL
jgi:hypothetical protein